MVQHTADGGLHAWEEIADRDWGTLLVGNGLSINISKDFAYDSLFEQAEKDILSGGLEEHDRAIFERFGTSNFETVLGKLRDAIAMAEVVGQDEAPYRRHFRAVQQALGTAIRSVHVGRSEVADDALQVIKGELAGYRAIFSTSYDLIIYWAIGHEEEYDDFCDCFWGARHEFDVKDAEVRTGRTPIYYCHGALHLVVEGSGVTRKLVRDGRTLLDQFGKPIPRDPEARPLLITEGSARDKLRAIEGNDYLAHVYETFKENSQPLLVFGHALGEQDRHLIDAINAHPDRPVAVSMRKKGRQALRRQKAEIWGRLEAEEVYFFDAGTHPLGSEELARVARVG